ncbi:MAG: penicillin-binding transpeptidase domain-containing protein, partial [Sporomusa sp.]
MLTKRFNGRLEIMSLIMVLIFVALVSRLGYLQLAQGQYYERLADGNRIRLIPIMAPRGVFYDRNGVMLVSNRPGFIVSLLPISGPVPDEVLNKLAGILNMDVQNIKGKLAQSTGSFDPVRIKTDVGPDIITKIEERRAELPGVVIEIQPLRNYINNELAAHIFGYVGEINDVELEKRKADGYKAADIVGKFGLEALYDKEIRGIDGGNQVEVDVNGRPVQVLGKKDPVPGHNLVLTIDYRIQKAAEAAIDEQLTYLQTKTRYTKARAAAAVVINPKTGEILAMVSKPAFNPNLFNGGIS